MFNPLASHQMESLESRKLLAAGSLDNSYVSPFDGQSNFAMSSDRIVIQKDGKSIHYAILGDAGIPAPTIWRENLNGSLDTSFGSAGKISVPQAVYAWALQDDGKIVAIISSTYPKKIHLTRYDSNGTLDVSFGRGGRALISDNQGFTIGSMAMQSDGKIVLAGSNGIDAVVYRVTKNGRIDKNFGSHGATVVPHHGRATYVLGEVAVRPSDNRIIAVGEQNLGSIASARYAVGKDWAVFEFNNRGRLGRRLMQPTRASDFTGGNASHVAVDSDGSVLIVGNVSHSNTGLGISASTSTILARYPARLRKRADAVEIEQSGPIAIQNDGKIIVADYQHAIRYNHDLSRDNTFVSGIPDNMDFQATAIALQSDGGLLLDGFNQYNQEEDFAIFQSIRLSGDSAS